MKRSASQLNTVRKTINVEDNTKLSAVFRALGDVNRLTIVKLLLEAHNLCVSELAGVLRVSIPAVSQHLGILEHAGIGLRRRHGQNVCFELNEDKSVLKLVKKVLSV